VSVLPARQESHGCGAGGGHHRPRTDLPKVLDSLWPAVWHHVERDANNRVESDHAQLKRRLRPMRGIKTMTGLRVLAAGHAFVQNLRRGHYEIAADRPRNLRLAIAFGQPATAVCLRRRARRPLRIRHDRPTRL
jgi:LPS sulfotransferase NodH